MKNKILLIEDDLTIQTLVSCALEDMEIVFANNLSEAYSLISNQIFQVLLLDIHLPDGDGLNFLTKLAQYLEFKKMLVFIISGKTDISNKVKAFSFGVDDFISKPFDPIDLQVRLLSKIRKRSFEQDDHTVRCIGNLVIDFKKQKVFFDSISNLSSSSVFTSNLFTRGSLSLKDSIRFNQEIYQNVYQNIELTSIEFKILDILTEKMERIFSRQEILKRIWGSTVISQRTIDSHIAHLRKKLLLTSIKLETSKNLGYYAKT